MIKDTIIRDRNVVMTAGGMAKTSRGFSHSIPPSRKKSRIMTKKVAKR